MNTPSLPTSHRPGPLVIPNGSVGPNPHETVRNLVCSSHSRGKTFIRVSDVFGIADWRESTAGSAEAPN